jgi:membrane associated rhomboid family serine protease
MELKCDPQRRAFLPPDAQTTLEWEAVLSSQRIPYRLRGTQGNWRLEVLGGNYFRAKRELLAYENDRAFFAMFGKTPRPTPLRISRPTMVVSALLLAGYALTGPFDHRQPWCLGGEMSTVAVKAGQWWRTITALTLHADAPHVLGNAAFLALFVGPAAWMIGPGAALLLTLLGGALGNVLTAWLRTGAGYHAVGASTAVFAALGLTTALRLLDRRYRRTLPNAWLPLLAAVALLGLTGTAPGSDLAGHAFGFVAGLAMGLPGRALHRWRKRPWIQRLFLAAGTVMIILAWWTAHQAAA